MREKTIAHYWKACFPEGTVYVRPITNKERYEHMKDDLSESAHALVDQDGDVISIVCGAPQYAFVVAESYGVSACWIH
jgi:hypothetical protein